MPPSRTPPERSPVDPRPDLARGTDGSYRLAGSRCAACGYPMAVAPPRCPACGGGPMAPAEFGPGATVFSSTVLEIPTPGRKPPYALAYVDVDAGPRVLVHLFGELSEPLAPGRRVELCGFTDHGDPCAREVAA